jgi:hypothetical protein
VRVRPTFKKDLQELKVYGSALDSSGAEKRPVVDFCRDSNESSYFIKGREIIN